MDSCLNPSNANKAALLPAPGLGSLRSRLDRWFEVLAGRAEARWKNIELRSRYY